MPTFSWFAQMALEHAAYVKFVDNWRVFDREYLYYLRSREDVSQVIRETEKRIDESRELIRRVDALLALHL
jgi:hypothetical protein